MRFPKEWPMDVFKGHACRKAIFAPSRMIFLIALALALGGCAVPGSSRYYKYTMDIVYNNKPYSFSEYIRCYGAVQPSEGPEGPLYIRQEREGAGFVVIKLDPHHTLFSQPDYAQAICLDTKPHEFVQPVAVLETDDKMSKLSIIRGESSYPPISAIKIHSEPINRIPERVGPSDEQIAFTKKVLDEQKHRFESVSARIIPFDVWATTEQSRNYFSKFSSVAIAKVGEAPPVSGREDTFVQFKFYLDRKYDLSRKQQELEMTYSNGVFKLPNEGGGQVQTFYSVSNRNESQYAVVNYKGTLVSVLELQEINDPTTKNIFLFYKKSASNLAALLGGYLR